MKTIRTTFLGLGVLAAVGLLADAPVAATGEPVIVQAASLERAAAAVAAAGGRVSHELEVIDAVGTTLDAGQRRRLAEVAPEARVYRDLPALETAGRPSGRGREAGAVRGRGTGRERQIERKGLDTEYPTLIEADWLHKQGIDGRGVTIAFIDTGVWAVANQIETGIATDADGAPRIRATYNAVHDLEAAVIQLLDSRLGEILATPADLARDGSGHGTHVASVAASSYRAKLRGNDRVYNGVAPNAGVVVVKAFDDGGAGTYLDVIRGIDWVVANRERFGIRVLNLSFSAEPRSAYWDDPLNQAVMAAWQAGIVVVASAGNRGPHPMTVGVPGNVPYVITVGAMSDAATSSPTDDFLASFSSAGPTFEGFVKPEVLAPGGHIRGLMPVDSRIAVEHPEYHDGASYFTMSGTSQATAVVAGAAALMLQVDPELTPDDVKCRLMDSAAPAVEPDPVTEELELAYSVFQQGAGLINARRAALSLASGCANRGLDVGRDLAGVEHYGGRANFDPERGAFYLMDLEGDGFMWNDGFMWSDGFRFHENYVRPDGFMWSDGFIWNDGYMWSDAFLWSDAFVWNDAASTAVSINTWVEQE